MGTARRRLASAPTVASWAPGRLDVFARGLDGQLWRRGCDGAWASWELLGGGFNLRPAAASWAEQRIDVFARGLDSQLWHLAYDHGWR